MSIGSLLNVSRNALASYQLAIDVTGGNIANINTPGYSRQRAILATRGNVQAHGEAAQIGVEVKNIERIFDAFTELQVTEQQQRLGFSQTKSNYLQRVEIIFDETKGNKLNDFFGRFWEAWSDLANNPGGQVERDAVLSAAQALAEEFNNLGDQLYSIQKNIDTDLVGTVTGINSLAAAIASLNNQIAMFPHDAGEANTLMDKRTELLKQLSYQLDCHYVEGANGALNIYLPNGQALVEGESIREMIVVKSATSDFHNVVLAEQRDVVLNSSLSAKRKGVLGASLVVRDNILTDYLQKLDDLAKTLMEGVNAIHRTAYDNHGNLGGDFFVLRQTNSTSYARTLAVNGAIIASLHRIAASATVTGDGAKAGEIATLKDRLLMNSGRATLGEYYSSMVGEIGRDIATATSNTEYQNNTLVQLQNQRESVSGVSLNEEMMNLVKFQLAYSAAGKLCQVANELMDSLMDLVR